MANLLGKNSLSWAKLIKATPSRVCASDLLTHLTLIMNGRCDKEVPFQATKERRAQTNNNAQCQLSTPPPPRAMREVWVLPSNYAASINLNRRPNEKSTLIMQHAQSLSKPQSENAHRAIKDMDVFMHSAPYFAHIVSTIGTKDMSCWIFIAALAHIAPRLNELILYIEARLDSCGRKRYAFSSWVQFNICVYCVWFSCGIAIGFAERNWVLPRLSIALIFPRLFLISQVGLEPKFLGNTF